MILFLIGLLIYILITNDNSMKKLFFVMLIIYFLNNLYNCIKKWNVIEKENFTPNNIDYKKQIYDLLNGKMDILKNVDLFEINNIGENLRYKSQCFIKIKPINFMFMFIHVKEYELTNSSDKIDSDKLKGFYKINYPETFKNVIGAQITHTFNNNIKDNWSSNGNFNSKIEELNKDFILFDSGIGSTDKSSCYVMIYGNY